MHNKHAQHVCDGGGGEGRDRSLSHCHCNCNFMNISITASCCDFYLPEMEFRYLLDQQDPLS